MSEDVVCQNEFRHLDQTLPPWLCNVQGWLPDSLQVSAEWELKCWRLCVLTSCQPTSMSRAGEEAGKSLIIRDLTVMNWVNAMVCWESCVGIINNTIILWTSVWVQLRMCLPCMCQDLSLTPRAYIKITGMVTQVCNLRAWEAETRWLSLTVLPVQPAW